LVNIAFFNSLPGDMIWKAVFGSSVATISDVTSLNTFLNSSGSVSESNSFSVAKLF